MYTRHKWRINDPGTGTDIPNTDNTDGGADNPGTSIDTLNADIKVASPGTGIYITDTDADGGADPGTGIDTTNRDADGQTAISD